MRPDVYEGKSPVTWPIFAMDPDATDARNSSNVKEMVKLSCKYTQCFIFTMASLDVDLQMLDFNNPLVEKLFIAEGLKGVKSKNLKAKQEDLATSYEMVRVALSHSKIFFSFIYAMVAWVRGGTDICVLGPNMQRVFEYTDLSNISINDISLPMGDAMYFALPGFDGLISDPETGEHFIRGVMIYQNSNGIGVCVWGKPKMKHDATIGGFMASDTYFTSMALKSKYGDWSLEDWLDSILIQEIPTTSGLKNTMSEKAVKSIQLAVKIAFNSILYWKNAEDKMDIVHPDQKAKVVRLQDLKNRLSGLQGKKRRSLQSTIDFEETVFKKEGTWFYIEPEEVTGVPERNATSINSERASRVRRSPKMHIRRGHWRQLASGKMVLIKPQMIGKTFVAPRYWKSKLDD